MLWYYKTITGLQKYVRYLADAPMSDLQKKGAAMNEFSSLHPIVTFTYFALTIGFSMFFMNPILLTTSLTLAVLHSIIQDGARAVKFNLLYMLPIIVLTALINPAFNHEGVTILAYLPSGNPLTLESVIYGVASAFMLASVICRFSVFNKIFTSDKLICLFGRILPSLSLIISMTLRFVPRFKAQLKAVADAQKCIGRDITSGNLKGRIKNGLNILSSLTSWSLENAIETADSMKARGYGLSGRTAFSIYRFDKRDFTILLLTLALGIYVTTGAISGKIDYKYFPSFKLNDFSFYGISVYIAYGLLCALPIIFELWEVTRWKASK